MNNNFADKIITIDLEEAINTFACVAGVFYINNDDSTQLLVPHYTGADYTVVDCTVYDRATMECAGDYYPFYVSSLCEAIDCCF